MTVELTSEWHQQHMARAVPNSYLDRDTKTWMVDDPTPHEAAVILRLFPELSGNEVLVKLRDELQRDVRPFDNATPTGMRITGTASHVAKALGDDDKWWYQFQDLDLGYVKAVLEEHGGAYIGWERGLGKTLGACSLIDALGCQRTLVVCPNTAKTSVWAAEIARWLPGHHVHVLPNAKTKRERLLRSITEGWQAEKDPRISRIARANNVLVIHYEALPIIAGKTTHDKDGLKLRTAKLGDGWRKLGQWDLVVCDEAHRIKNPKAQMTRALKKVPAKHKLALSGSIIQNHAEELFSVLQWLFPERYKAKWRDWNDRYLDYVEGGWGKLCVGVKPARIAEMRRELGVFMVYRRKVDELDLPPKTEQTLLVDLSPAQRKAYDEMLAQYHTVLEDGTLVKAADHMAQLTRLRQLATGLDALGKTVADSSKLDTAEELILDNEDEAFVVFSWYKAPCYTLAERLEKRGVQCHVVTGDTKQADRADAIAAFQGGAGRVFIGTLATLGESVNLQRASNAVFLDRSWNPAQNVQAADRIYRIGQSRAVTITHLVARHTVDELRVLPVLANKEALRRSVFGGE